MSRLPELETALERAARRLDRQERPEPARWWRRRAPLLAAVVALAGGGTLAAATTGLLDTGDPVPSTTDQPGRVVPDSVAVLEPRVGDPDGGPAWAIGVFDLDFRPIARAPRLPAGQATCVRIGRVQGDVLGVVGRDHLFGDDGRFHPLPPEGSFTGSCGGSFADGQLLMTKGGGRVPASGYTGDPFTRIGGCRAYGPPRQAVSTAVVRRRLEQIPRCDPGGLRILKYGFAGREAVKVRVRNDRVDRTVTPSADGAWLFVLRRTDAGVQPLRVTATYRDGTVCRSPGRFGIGEPLDGTDPCLPPPGFEVPGSERRAGGPAPPRTP